MTGTIEVLFLPTYQMVAAALVEDSVITVQGRVNDRDGAISIFGQELQVLDATSAERDGAAPVQLRLPYHRINELCINELKRIMGAHPGQNPVQLAVRGPQKTIVYQLPSLVNAATIASDIKGSLARRRGKGWRERGSQYRRTARLREIVLNVGRTPPCPSCSRPTILLARYPHSWRNNKGGTVSGFRGSVLCRVCDRDDSAAAPLVALDEEDGSFQAEVSMSSGHSPRCGSKTAGTPPSTRDSSTSRSGSGKTVTSSLLLKFKRDVGQPETTSETRLEVRSAGLALPIGLGCQAFASSVRWLEETVTIAARLITTITAPLDPASAEAPQLLCWPNRTLLVQRGDAEVVALDVDEPDAGRGSDICFPAPWPRRFGRADASTTDAAVFAGRPRSTVGGGDRCDAVGSAARLLGRLSSALHASFDEYAVCTGATSALTAARPPSAQTASSSGHTSAGRWPVTGTRRTSRNYGWFWTP